MDGPVVGRIVYYVFDQRNIERVREQRLSGPGEDIVAPGNPIYEGDRVAAVVTAVFGDEFVNLKVFLDGPDLYWATDVKHDHAGEPGSWMWMFSQQNRYVPAALKAPEVA